MMSLCILDVVARHYVAHHQWPSSRAQLEEQWQRVLAEDKEEVSPAEAKELSGFLQHFTILELQKSGRNLRFHYRFTVAGETVDQKAVLKPGVTVDEIIESSSN